MAYPDLPEGFFARKCLHTSRRSSVYLAERESDGRAVVLKTFGSSPAALDRARRELESIRAFDHPRIVRALGLTEDLDTIALVLDYIPGISVREWVDNALPELANALCVAAQLAEIMTHVHDRHVVHRDLTPANVIVQPATLQVYLIDLGLARPLGSVTTPELPSAGTSFVGTLEYLAPEQTGRMNRAWSLRSDLYTFGATLYFLLTGRPPFAGSDALELIHAHIARVPDDPRTRRQSIPAPLARLVLRLLEKEPEERYPSAAALHTDLRALCQQLDATGSIAEDTPLAGLLGRASPLSFPSQLFGREEELTRLQETYRSAQVGPPRALMVSGPPGVGKSALVNALRPAIGDTGGVLTWGKFDPYHARPYSAWISALESLTHQLLVLSEVHLGQLRGALQRSLGPVARALVDLVPDLGFILGDVPNVPRLGPRETQERMALALGRAIGALATNEHPLVVVLEDLHAADEGSLFLTEALFCSDALRSSFLLIGTFSEDEVDSEHPLTQWIERLRERRVRVDTMELGPLSRQAAVQVLSQVLEREPEDVRSLAAQIERKTGNSPFLLREFLQNLQLRGLLRREDAGWTWDPEQIHAEDIPEGAVGLILARIARLEPGATAVLRFAACAADVFTIDFLVELGCGERADVERSLFSLADAGLIVPAIGGFRFAHDRIRSTAQSSLDAQERERLHYETGRFLLANTPEAQLEERASLIAEHFNRARSLVCGDLRIDLVRINWLAGRHALRAGAIEQASRHFSTANQLLLEQDRQQHADLFRSVHASAAEAELLCGRYAASLELLGTLDTPDLSLMERAHLESRRILVFALTRSPEEALHHVVKVYRSFGLRLSARPSRLSLWLHRWRGRRALERTDYGLRWKQAQRPDPSWAAPLVFSRYAGGVLSRSNAMLTVLTSSRAADTYSRHGSIGNPAIALASCALIECMTGGDPRRAARASEAALAWLKRNDDPTYDARVTFVIHGLVYPWLIGRRKALARLPRIAEQAREVGEPETAYYVGINHTVDLALAGENIEVVDEMLQALSEGVARRGERYPEAAHCHRLHRLLLEPDPADSIPARVAELEPSAAAMHPSGSVYYRTLSMQILCVHGRFDLAFEQSERIYEDLFRVVPFVHVTDHSLYRGLAAAALAETATGRERRRLRKALVRSARHLARWARWGPDFAHMVLLLSAERARLEGDPRPASRLYDQAARGAEQQGFIQHAALAYERKSQLLAAQRRGTESAAALKRACELYSRWGRPDKAHGTR